MTTEIIIDGVDISKCEHSFKQFDNWSGKNIISCDYTLGFRCEPRKNHCKFYMEHLEQQLKLAEQKLKKIKDYFYTYIELEPDHLKTDILNIIEGGENEKQQKTLKNVRQF